MSAELETLCQSCGMCCDGSLFRRGLLRPEEVEPARKHGLKIVEDRFEIPCPQLRERSCQVYEVRPSVCKSFICRLYARHRDEGGPIEPRLQSVRRTRELIATLGKFGLTRTPDGEVHFEAEGEDAMEAMEAFGELMTRLEEDFGRAAPSPHPDAAGPKDAPQ